MAEKNMKDIKLPDLSYLKSSVESYNRLNVDSMTIQDPKTLVNPQTEMMANIEQNTSEMKDNNKNQFWKNLITAVIGGAIGGAVPYLLVLIFG